MSEHKSLFHGADGNYRYTEEGSALDAEFSKAIRPILEKCWEQGLNPREVNIIGAHAVNDLCLTRILLPGPTEKYLEVVEMNKPGATGDE